MIAADIHARKPNIVEVVRTTDKFGIERQFYRIQGLEWKEGHHYRLLRDRRFRMRKDDEPWWVLVECKTWSKAHLYALKEQIMRHGYGELRSIVAVDGETINVHRPEDLTLMRQFAPVPPGIYLVRTKDIWDDREGVVELSGSEPLIVR